MKTEVIEAINPGYLIDGANRDIIASLIGQDFAVELPKKGEARLVRREAVNRRDTQLHLQSATLGAAQRPLITVARKYVLAITFCLALAASFQFYWFKAVNDLRANHEKALSLESTEIGAVKGDVGNLTSIVKFLVEKTKENDARPVEVSYEAALEAQTRPVVTKPTVVEVSALKANLRKGPSDTYSSLMTLAQGSKLAVQETNGEWVKVFAPNGEPAWVARSVISFRGMEQ